MLEIFAAAVSVLTSRLAQTNRIRVLEFPTLLMKEGYVLTMGDDISIYFNAWVTMEIMAYNGGHNYSGVAAQNALRGLSTAGIDQVKILKLMLSFLQNNDFELVLTLLGKNPDVPVSFEGILILTYHNRIKRPKLSQSVQTRVFFSVKKTGFTYL